METRHLKLKNKVKELGLYETGMSFDEMQQIVNAIDESIPKNGFNAEEIELALRESEKDFAPGGNLCNSTMVGLCDNTNVLEFSTSGHCQSSFGSLFSTNFSSPEEAESVERIITVAEVHHEMNWTPRTSLLPNQNGETMKQRLARKRAADAISQDDSGIILSANSSLYETTNL